MISHIGNESLSKLKSIEKSTTFASKKIKIKISPTYYYFNIFHFAQITYLIYVEEIKWEMTTHFTFKSNNQTGERKLHLIFFLINKSKNAFVYHIKNIQGCNKKYFKLENTHSNFDLFSIRSFIFYFIFSFQFLTSSCFQCTPIVWSVPLSLLKLCHFRKWKKY